ncbi:MAG: efflux RND transporter periplasmic adaptor subunit [Bacteroidota bacterium]
MKTNTFLSIILLSGLLLFSACSTNDQSKSANETDPVKVEMISPKSTVQKELHYKGKLQSSKSASLQTRGMGYVENVYVKVGDQVKQGELLVRLNSADLAAKKAQTNAKLQEIEANLKSAERDLNRYKNLRDEGSVSSKELEDMQLRYDAILAQKQAVNQQLAEVKAELNYFEIKAPFDGVVTAKNIKKGDMASPQQVLVNIEAAGVFEFTTQISERHITKFNAGDSAKIQVPSLNKTYDAHITEVSSSSVMSGGQYRVKAVLNDDKKDLFSGMRADLSLQIPSEKQGVFIPKAALIERGDLKGVYTKSKQGVALLRWVRIGEVQGDMVEILSGLSADESVVINASSKLYNGLPITE